jgi:hypothetical protein
MRWPSRPYGERVCPKAIRPIVWPYSKGCTLTPSLRRTRSADRPRILFLTATGSVHLWQYSGNGVAPEEVAARALAKTLQAEPRVFEIDAAGPEAIPTFASFLCGSAQNLAVLIAARAPQGAGAALRPCTGYVSSLNIIQASWSLCAYPSAPRKRSETYCSSPTTPQAHVRRPRSQEKAATA